jgi:RNA polymerase-binding transcription factor DksA
MNAASHLPGNNMPPASQNVPTYFSKADYEEFETLIRTKLAESEATLELLKQTFIHDRSNGTDDTYMASNIQEDGQATLEREEAVRLAQRQELFIQQLKAALIRIQNKTYGICRATGKPISKERLRIVPHATLSIDAKSRN